LKPVNPRNVTLDLNGSGTDALVAPSGQHPPDLDHGNGWQTINTVDPKNGSRRH